MTPILPGTSYLPWTDSFVIGHLLDQTFSFGTQFSSQELQALPWPPIVPGPLGARHCGALLYTTTAQIMPERDVLLQRNLIVWVQIALFESAFTAEALISHETSQE